MTEVRIPLHKQYQNRPSDFAWKKRMQAKFMADASNFADSHWEEFEFCDSVNKLLNDERNRLEREPMWDDVARLIGNSTDGRLRRLFELFAHHLEDNVGDRPAAVLNNWNEAQNEINRS